jgi:hypothetical protein
MGSRNRTGARDPADSLSERRDEPGQFMLMITKGHGMSRCPQLCDEIEFSSGERSTGDQHRRGLVHTSST